VAMAEVKGVLPGSQVHHHDSELDAHSAAPAPAE
jgi:hypothetical protein